MTFTKAKAVAASIGSTATALVIFIGVLIPALDDGKLSGGELGTLATAAVTLTGTVYAVWRTPNKVIK